jgi:hypothetical protein
VIVAALTSTQSNEIYGLIFGSLVLAALVVLQIASSTIQNSPAPDRAHPKGAKITWKSEMGQGQWEFSSSYATNVAVLGSVLTTILASTALPSTTKILPSDAYGALGVFFGLTVAVAPMLYSGTTTHTEVKPAEFDTAAEYHGKVWGFVLAVIITVWGLLGSLATGFLTLLEIEYGGALPSAAGTALAVLLGLTALFVLNYTNVHIVGILKDQFDPPIVTRRSAGIKSRRHTLELPERNDLTDAKPRWTVL